MMRRALPDLLIRSIAAFTALTFISLQLFAPVARAEDNPLPTWLKEDQGGWLSAEKAQRMQRADQDLLAHLSSLANAQERSITTHPSGLQAQYANQELVVTRDAAGNLLWAPALDDYKRVQNGTLLLVDGTLQVVKSGQLARQVAVDGTETVYRTDGRVDHETALDGTRTDYSYQGQSPSGTVPFTRITHLPNGNLVQEYDANGRLTRETTPDGKVSTYSGGILTTVSAGGFLYTYSPQTAADGTVTANLSQATGPDGAVYTLAGGQLMAIRWSDGTAYTITNTNITDVTLLDGRLFHYDAGWLRQLKNGTVLSNYSYTFDAGGNLSSITVTAADGSSRIYSAAGTLQTITDPDKTRWTVVDGLITRSVAPNGALTTYTRLNTPYGQQIVRQASGITDRFSFDASGKIYAAGTDRNLSKPTPFTSPLQSLNAGALTATGIVATDGKYLYVKPWGNSSKIFTKVGTGLGGTIAGKVYGTLTGSVGNTISATVYSDGMLYQLDPTTPTRLEQINPVTGAKTFINVPAGLLRLDTATVAAGQILITSDGRYIYNLSFHQTRNTTTYNGWTIRVFDPKNNWALAKQFTVGTSSFRATGLMSDGTFLYALEWTNTNSARVAVIRIADGTVVQTRTTNQLTTKAIGGQYDWVNQRFWWGAYTTGKVYAYADPNSLSLSNWVEREGLRTPVAQTQLADMNRLRQPSNPYSADLQTRIARDLPGTQLVYQGPPPARRTNQPDGLWNQATWPVVSHWQMPDLPVVQDPGPLPEGNSLTQILAGGSVALYVEGQLVQVITADSTKLLHPVLEADGRISGGWLITPDGITTFLQGGPAVWSKDTLGTVTWYLPDGKIRAIRAGNGMISTYSYQMDAAGQLASVLVSSQDGSLLLLDPNGRPIEKIHRDGRRLFFHEGRLSRTEFPGEPAILYTESIQSDGSILSVRPEPIEGRTLDLPRRFLYGTDGSLREVTQTDGTVLRFSGGLPTDAIAPDGTVTHLLAEQVNQTLKALSVTRNGITRTYDAAGQLKQLTLPDKTTLELKGDALQAVQLPDGTMIRDGVYDANSHLVSGQVTLPDGRQVRYEAGQPVALTLKDGSRITYAGGQPSQLNLPNGSTYSVAHGNSWIATLNPVPGTVSVPGTDVLTSLTYSDAWVLQQATRADGALLTYQNGRLNTLTQTDGTVISYAYDNAGKLTSTVAANPDPNQPAIRSEYAYDRIRKVFKGNTLLYEYSYEFDQGLSPQGTVPDSSTEITVVHEIATGLAKRYRAGQLISQTDPDGAVTTYEYTADSAGYSDPLKTASELNRTLPGGTIAHYQRTGPGATDWTFSKLLRPDGTELSAAGQSADTLADTRGVGQASGKIGNAAQFHHADWQYLTAPDTADLSMGQYGFTFSTWVYMDSKPSEAVIFHKGRTTYMGTEYVLLYTGGSTDRFRFAVQDGTEYGARTDGHGLGSPGTGQWYFITCWFDPADHYIKMQINNGSIDTAPLMTGSYDSSGPFRVGDFNFSNTPGYDTPGYNSSWDGRIDELGIWKRVLTDQERAQLYNSGQGNRFDPSSFSFQTDTGSTLSKQLVTYYTLDEPSGSRSDSADLSGLLAQAALPSDHASLQRMVEQGTLSLRGPSTVIASGEAAKQSPVLSRATVTYQGKPRESFTYQYSSGLTQVTDESGTIRSYDSSGRLTAIQQADGTRYEISYDRDLSESQLVRIANLHSDDPELLHILQNPEGDRIVTHRLTQWALPDGSLITSNFSPETVVEQEFDASGNLISRTQANGQVTLYDHQQPIRTYDPQGNTTTTFDYDSTGRLTKITLIAARREMADRINQLTADVSARRTQALEELARQKGLAIDQLSSQTASARTQLADQLTALGHKLDDIGAMKAHGKSGRRAKSEALDQIRGGINQVRDTQNNLEQQYAQALGALESQVESVRQQIETESNKAFTEIAAKETDFSKEILRQEISTIVISAYRSTIGRDPSGDELQQEVQRLYDRYGSNPSAAVDLQDLTQRITALPDYTGRAGQVAAIKQQVTDWLTHYSSVIASGEAAKQSRLEMISSLGLTPDQAVPLSTNDIQRILNWLNSRPLHFGHSAFLALQEYLQGLSPQGTVPDLITLATEAILSDILIGVITPKVGHNADLEISLFTLGLLARRHGATATAAQVAFGDLKPLLNGSTRLIAHVNGNHYIVLISIADDGTVTYREPNAGPNGQTLTMTQADFQKIWRGVILTSRAPPHVWQILTDRESQRITGAFFPLIFLALAWIASSIGAAITAVVSAITTLIAALGSLISGIFSALGTAFSSIGSFFGGFGSFFSGLGAISQGLGGIFAGNLLAGLGAIAEGLTIAIPGGLLGVGLNIGVSKGLEALGVSSTIASLAGAFVSGGVTGALNPVSTTSGFLTNFTTSALTSTAIAGTQIGLVKAGLDPALASIASIGVGIIAGSMLSGISKIDPVTGKTITLRGLDGLNQTLHTTFAPTMAGELAFYGVQKLGETIGLDPRISQLAGVPIQQSISSYLTGAKGETILQGMSAGLLRGATSIGLESAAQELNLDPLVGSLATAGISGSIEAMLEERNPLQGVADTYFNSATGLLTLGSPGTTSLERALYLSKVNDLSQTIREQGIGKALQTYATSILHRQTIENIWKLGGIYDLLANRDQIEFLTNSEGIQVKRIHTDTQKRDYIELTLGDDRLIGKREGNVIMHCDYVTGPDGKAVMRNGEVEILSEDGSHVLRKETVRDFKLVEIKKYSRSGNMIEVITSVDDQGILVDSSGRVIHGIRRDLVEQVVTTYLEGKTAEIKLTRPYEPTPGEKALLLNMGYTEEEISLFVQDEILSAQYGQQTLNSFIRQRDGSAIDTVSATGKHWLQLVTDRTNLRWSYLMRIIGHPPETRVELDSRRRIEQIDLDLDFPGVPVIAPNDWFIWDELIPFAANIAPNWNTAIMDATPELVGAVANKDADFIFVSGINHFRKTLDELNWMKESLATSKRIIVAHSAGTEVAIRSMLSVHADKYILISPRMAPETLRLIMQESGIQSDQVIVVQSQGDFTTWGGSYINAPNSSFLHQPWTHIYIESGPGMSLLNPLPNHAIGIEGWLGGGTYQIRINGGSSISQSIAKILAEEVKK